MFGDAKGLTDPTEQGLFTLASPFIKVAEGIDWLLHPNHWIRIFCGIGGGIMVLGGTFQMFHTGGEIPVSGYGVSTSIGIPRAASLPLGILFTGIGGLLLFVAFHNLPGDVDSFPTFIGYLTDQIGGGTAAAASGTSAASPSASAAATPKNPAVAATGAPDVSVGAVGGGYGR